tara:strand:- start:299 stop:532 length:234 start_codon:yes stop_codon:yes gene_type:complete
MKQSWILPKLIKLIKENDFQDFTANSMSKVWNDRYKNSVSSNQLGQLFNSNSIFSKRVDPLFDSDVYIWSIKEGGVF